MIRLRLLLPLLLVLGGCASLTGPARPPAPLEASDIAYIARILRFEDRREYDAGAFSHFARWATPEVRRRTALAAGRIGAPAAADLLLELLADSASSVRAAAAFALGQLGDTSAIVVRALDAASRAPDPDMAGEAVHALGKLRGAAARSSIADALQRDAREPGRGTVAQRVVAEALLAAWKFGHDNELAPLISRFASSRDAELRWRAAYAFMRGGDPRGLPTLLRAVGDDDHRVRAHAARGLRAELADSLGLLDAARTALLALLADPHPHVRINAVRALGGYEGHEVEQALIGRLAAPRVNEAVAAAEGLTGPAEYEAVAALERVVADPARPVALRGTALVSLAAVHAGLGAEWVARLAGSDAWLERLYAARALAPLPWEQAAEPYARLVRDEDARVAATALFSLAAAGAATAGAARPLLLEALAHPDPVVRAGALGALEQLADPADLGLVLDAYARAQRDAHDDAALAAVDALAALAERGAPAARSFFARFERSSSALVRQRVAEHLGDAWGDPLPVETERAPGFYEQVVRELLVPALAGSPRPIVVIQTRPGDIALELLPEAAPLTVHNFITLAERGFFDGGRWHRVVPNFVLQDGDPRGDGTGGPPWAIRDEINPERYLAGTMGMALAGPDTGGSQFFITHSPQPHLDGGYTVFGRVVAGMDAANAVVQDDPIERVRIER